MNLIFYTHKVYSSRVSVQTMGALGDSERRQDTPGSWRRRDKIVLASSRPTLSGLLAGDATVSALHAPWYQSSLLPAVLLFIRICTAVATIGWDTKHILPALHLFTMQVNVTY